MPSPDLAELRCFLAIPSSPEYYQVCKSVATGAEKAGFEPLYVDEQSDDQRVVRDTVMAELARADCVVADLTNSAPIVYLQLGLALAMGKPVFVIVRRAAAETVSMELRDIEPITYEPTPIGRGQLSQRISDALRLFRNSPSQASLPGGARSSTPFVIDWDRLDLSDAENLCRELLSQMGLRRIDWYKESPEVDLIAEYPRKDPDGFEYRELWLVCMGRNATLKKLLSVGEDPDGFLDSLLHRDERLARSLSNREVTAVTLLFIPLQNGAFAEELKMVRQRRSRTRRNGFSLRVRLWDREQLTALVQQFPNIGYKYFSDEARSLSKFRKGPEELHQENLVLSQRLARTIAQLEEETNRRIRAERDAVWKDISFAAAHKIGNPIFAIETDLDPLQKRIIEHRTDEAVEVVANIRAAVEKAKNIVEQFKSLTKAQKIKPVPILLRPILDDCCRVPESQNVACEIECPADIRIQGDPERLSEVFDELAANSLRWFDKPERQVRLKAAFADPTALPAAVDSERRYVVIHFADNGPGIDVDRKDDVFQAFITTYQHGAGLGLALVRRTIEEHGGVILESGVPGDGVDFEIYLPLADDAEK